MGPLFMSPFRSAISAATTALLAGGLCIALPTTSFAAPPTAESFDILYYTTDADAAQARQMTANDLQGYVNQARCECGQNVSARVRIRSDAGAPDNVQVRTFVGDNCGQGQNGINPQNRPCALVLDEFANAYTRNINFSFNPLWLATGVSGADGGNQAIDQAVAARDCGSGQGNGGVWICVEDGSQTDCQDNEFIVQGSQNINATDDMGGSVPLTYDFAGPNITATGFSVVGGDGAIQVSWDNDSTGDTNGFRVLCAELDGSPVSGKGFSPPNITAENRGTTYYTKDNLCPDGPFSEVPVDDMPDAPIPVPETTGSGGGSSGGDDGTGTGGFGLGDAPDPLRDHSSCCAAHGEAGCDDEVCQSIVCETNGLASCCDSEWNQTCAESAVRDCVAACGEHAGSGSTTGGTTSGSMSDTDSTTNVSATDSTTSGSGTATDTDTDSGTATGTGTGGGDEFADSPIHSLDWAYVCSDHMPFNASQARITGLENGREYQILVVAYDRAGNPSEASAVLTAEPRETTDLWEQCEEQGNVCGKGGFCSCTTDQTPADERLLWLGLGVLGLVARRRRGAAK